MTNSSLPVNRHLHGQPRNSTTESANIENHDVISSGSFTDGFGDKRPRERAKQALKTLA